MMGLVCNNCGYKQKEEHRTLDDENVPVSDRVSATVTRGKTKTKKKTKKTQK